MRVSAASAPGTTRFRERCWTQVAPLDASKLPAWPLEALRPRQSARLNHAAPSTPPLRLSACRALRGAPPLHHLPLDSVTGSGLRRYRSIGLAVSVRTGRGRTRPRPGLQAPPEGALTRLQPAFARFLPLARQRLERALPTARVNVCASGPATARAPSAPPARLRLRPGRAGARSGALATGGMGA